MCSCGTKGARGLLWTTWSVTMVVSIAYTLCAVIIFAKVYRFNSDDKDTSETMAVLVATFFSAFLIIFFAVMSFCLLLSKSVSRSKAGFMYGFLTSTSANLALIVLLCSLVMTGFKEEVKVFEKDATAHPGWTGGDTRLFTTTYALGYVTSAFYLWFFGVMFFAASGVDDPDPERRAEEERNEGFLN